MGGFSLPASYNTAGGTITSLQAPNAAPAFRVNSSVAAVPEPSSVVLFLTGLDRAIRRRSAQAASVTLYNPHCVLRLLTVLSLICVFTVGVMCAIACPEEPIAADHPGQSQECTKCISTHFIAEARTLNFQLSDFSLVIDCVQPQFQLDPLIENITFVSPPGNFLSLFPAAKAVCRI